MSDNEIGEIEVTDKRTGQPADLSVLEDTDTAFDPSTTHLALSKEEKRRTTALMLAIQGYKDLIIKDAEYLRVASDLARREEGPKIKAATMDAMVEAAIKFDMFIAGEFSKASDKPTTGGAQTEEPVESAEGDKNENA